VLVVAFFFVYEWVFPPQKPTRAPAAIDSVAAAPQGAKSSGAATLPTNPAASAQVAGPSSAAAVPGPPAPSVGAARPETLTVTTPATMVSFGTVGAAPLTVTMRDYRATVRDVSERATSPQVRLGQPGEALLSYAIVTPHDTIALNNVPFKGTTTSGAVVFQADVPRPAGGSSRVTISYRFNGDGYLSQVSGTVDGLSGPTAGYLLIALPTGFPSFEADTADDIRQLAYSFKPVREDASSVAFSRLQPDKPQLISGPLTWVAAKNKYFVVGLLAQDTAHAHQFAELHLIGAPKVNGVEQRAAAAVLLPLSSPAANAGAASAMGTFSFEMYAGPQDFRRLRALGRGFENLNPYGGFFHVIFQPFVTIVVVTILWMRDLLHINYGWILIILGVLTRVVLWPLNQRAMRTSLKLQAVQPEIQAVQNKYKNDQVRLQQEMMRVYKEHNMSPWSPIAGCLPMLLPWPIFAALYFVFRTTIEFRGVPFLWMHDISVKDPYYIMPILMGLTSFFVSWISMRKMPPNPQTKMMSYMMPAVMTFFFWRIAAGLNLYYFVQSLATVPQQWYLSNERAKAGGTGVAAPATAGVSGAKKTPPKLPARSRGMKEQRG
jgi:YidC/Oxa1 family membrane protein insertase